MEEGDWKRDLKKEKGSLLSALWGFSLVLRGRSCILVQRAAVHSWEEEKLESEEFMFPSEE